MTYRESRIQAIEASLEREKMKDRLVITLILVAFAIGFLSSCTTAPKQPDAFDTALGSVILQMFDVNGNPKQ